MKRLFAILLGAAVAFGALTLWALESGGVAILGTERSDGSRRETHVWFAADDGGIWIEAATPEREFLADLRRAPEVTLSVGGDSSSYLAEAVEGGHERIRSLLREKYGFRDWWVGLLQDTSRSVAVRLEETSTT